MIEKRSGLFRFQWINHENCDISNDNKILKKIKEKGGIQISKVIKF